MGIYKVNYTYYGIKITDEKKKEILSRNAELKEFIFDIAKTCIFGIKVKLEELDSIFEKHQRSIPIHMGKGIKFSSFLSFIDNNENKERISLDELEKFYHSERKKEIDQLMSELPEIEKVIKVDNSHSTFIKTFTYEEMQIIYEKKSLDDNITKFEDIVSANGLQFEGQPEWIYYNTTFDTYGWGDGRQTN